MAHPAAAYSDGSITPLRRLRETVTVASRFSPRTCQKIHSVKMREEWVGFECLVASLLRENLSASVDLTFSPTIFQEL